MQDGKPVLRCMAANDYEAVYQLWSVTEYLSLNECDEREAIELYLKRNPDASFVAEDDGVIVGCVLSGHDGRRGCLRHLAVLPQYRKSGLGRVLVKKALDALAAQGIGKCNIYVDDLNVPGMAFWKHMGWVKLEETFRMLQAATAT